MSARIKLDVYGAETDKLRKLTWDHRNRLIFVEDFNASDVLFQTVSFGYNYENLLTNRLITNGVTQTLGTRFEFNGSQLSVDSGENHVGNLYGHRIIYGPMTNMALFDVTRAGSTGGTVVFTLLGDHQNTVRDMVHREVSSGEVELINHI